MAKRPTIAQATPPSVEDIRHLVTFYKACVEEEDRRSLNLPGGQLGKAFIAPWQNHEQLFVPDATSCILASRRKDERDFLAKGQMAATGADTAYYAYPLFLDEHGYLAPLFFIEVEVADFNNNLKDDRIVVKRVGTNAIKVNYHLFQRKRYSEDELMAIQEDLEGSYATFAARLNAALAYLEDTTFDLAGGQIDDYDTRWKGPCWIRTPILFRSSYGAYTYNLRRDLDALLRYDFLQRDALATALRTLLGSVPPTATGQDIADPAELLPLNDAQEQAARAGLGLPLTVITGPPGTGKSQVVVDLLATSILSGKTVLFASKNNKAVDVVRQRLRDLLGEDLDFTLRLGNKEHMQQTEEELMRRLDRLGQTTPPDLQKAADKMQRRRQKLVILRQAHDALLQAQRRELEAATPVPNLWLEVTGEDGTWRYPLRELRDHLDLARALGGETRLGLLLWLKRLFMGSRLRQRLVDDLEAALSAAPSDIWVDIQVDVFANDDYGPLIQAFRQLIAYHQWLAARGARQQTATALRRLLGKAPSYESRVRALKQKLARAYQSLCRATWAQRVHAILPATRADALRYFDRARSMGSVQGKQQFKAVLDQFTASQQQLSRTLPVWIVTSLSTRNALPLKANLFDLVVIDEASQCDVASALPLLFRAKRVVVIGDPLQLRHISGLSKADEKRIGRETETKDLIGAWSYRSKSLYDLAASAALQAGHEPHFLNEHYRSHPDIIGFSNRAFYNNKLRVLTDLDALETRLDGHPLGVSWHTVQGSVPETVRSAYNNAEISALMDLIDELHQHRLLANEHVSLGVVTPFRAQSDRIKIQLRQAPWFKEVNGKLIVGTAHAFQGDECDIMIFSPVVADGIRSGARRWVAETAQLLNVAITRARASLHVVGDPEACRDAGGYLAEFTAFVGPTYSVKSP